MEIITGKSEPIKIGWPANSRLAEDCAPMREALEFEGSQGAYRSRFVPDAVFRTARVKDIARFIGQDIYQLGIIGDDTAIEASLEEKKPSDWTNFRPESLRFSSQNRWGKFAVQPSVFTLFGTREIEDKMNNAPIGKQPAGIILTSYPKLAKKLLARKRLQQPLPTMVDCALVNGCRIENSVDGQIESIVANRDIPGVIAGMDIVRTGDTLRSYDLVPILELLESRPGIWKIPKIYERETRQLNDIASALREKLASFLTGDSLTVEWGH